MLAVATAIFANTPGPHRDSGQPTASPSSDPPPTTYPPVSPPQLVATLTGHTGHVGSLAFSPDGKILASGSGDAGITLRVWNVATHARIATLTGHTDGVNCLAFSPDGKILASGSWDHTLGLWTVATHTRIATLNDPNIVLSVAFSPDGKTLASGSADTLIRL